MYLDKGLNDKWIKRESIQRIDDTHFTITLKEPLGHSWKRDIVGYPFTHAASKVTCENCDCAFQIYEDKLWIQVEDLRPRENRVYHIFTAVSHTTNNVPVSSFEYEEHDHFVIASNKNIAMKFPRTTSFPDNTTQVIPGPIMAVKDKTGSWFGTGTLEVGAPPSSVQTTLIANGPIWAIVEVKYSFPQDAVYIMRVRFAHNTDFVEIHETSTLPLNLKPYPRPFREIGSLGASHWDQPLDQIANPCERQFPTCRFHFDIDYKIDRMQTHSTASWEIMDLPLHSPTPKAYTTMRPVNPSMDGGWMSFYSSNVDTAFGVASMDVSHWRIPDDSLHPIHRTPGALAEVICLDDEEEGTRLVFPIQNTEREWLLNVMVKADHNVLCAIDKPNQPPKRLDPDETHPTWALRTHRGDYRLDKVKDWILDWSNSNTSHPSLLCKRSDFKQIRKTVESVPALKANYEKNKHIHSSDRHIIDNEKGTLASIEKVTKARRRVLKLLETGLNGPYYAIKLARHVRRYVIACDLEWNSFSEKEKQEVREVCAIAAYMLSDGDYWQYAWKQGETTYLPNFNTDIFTCYGLIGLFLDDHPNFNVWTQGMVDRLELDLKYYIREDGCGEENLGSYNVSTWTQLWLPAFWALKHCGVKDFSNDSRVHAASRFFLDILSPEDPRDNYKRSIPPIGHHPMAKKGAPVCAWLASFIKESQPELASQLMWFWNQAGSQVMANADHSGPEGDPHTLHYIFHDSSIQPKPYKQESKLLPHVGVVLHSHTDTRQGSFLLLKAGRVHSHHDADEGSFHYFGRGVPLALDGLPLINIEYDESAVKHNTISFDKPGYPSGDVESFVTGPECDYIKANIKPRFFDCDAMYLDDNHRSGFIRELIMVKARIPGAVEYMVIKDTVIGPDPCSWNLDVLSKEPSMITPNRIWFPGHDEEGFGMGLEVIMPEPRNAPINIEVGVLGEEYKSNDRSEILLTHVNWSVVEHWMMHVSAQPGTTFLTVLFPRKEEEAAPEVIYNEREQTMTINHNDGKDIIFTRSNNTLPVTIENIRFSGNCAIARRRGDVTMLTMLDGEEICFCEHDKTIQFV